MADERTRDNPIIKRHHIKSLLCFPLVHNEKKIGVCYLDHPLASHVFDEEDVKILEIFLHQAAITIENANLYRESLALGVQIRELHDEKEKQSRQLIKADKLVLLGTILSGAVHDIANPNSAIALNIMSVYGVIKEIERIVQDHNDETEGDRTELEAVTALCRQLINDTDLIDKNSRRIKAILNQLRTLYKEDTIHYNEMIDLNQIIRQVVHMLSFKLEKQPDALSLQLEENLPVFAGNYQALERVIVNLIINALNAIEDRQEQMKNKTAKRIVVRTRLKQGMIHLIVADNGLGMQKETLEKIKQPLFTTRPEKGGTGLGGYIIYEIVKQHKGTVSYFSRYLKGTIAQIMLPTAKSEELNADLS